jgi:hypothetical protein
MNVQKRITLALLLLIGSVGLGATEAPPLSDKTVHVSPNTTEEPFSSYYASFFKRLVAGGKANLPKVKGKSVYGGAVVVVTIVASGGVEKIEIVEASSPTIEKHTVALLKKLQPFEPFGTELRGKASRLVIVSHLNYIRAN